MRSCSKKELIETLKTGGIAIMPTDTIYGLVGQALNKKTVSRIYRLKKRPKNKPLIILISSLKQLSLFLGSSPSFCLQKTLRQYWSLNKRPTTIVLPLSSPSSDWQHLHRGQNSLAFRLPASSPSLLSLLHLSGPLVAPSANPTGLPPASDLSSAYGYFGDKVDAYYGHQTLFGRPSRLLSINMADNSTTILRP